MDSNKNKFFVLTFLLIFSISTMLGQKSPPAETGLRTEKQVYVKGENVVIHGSGFRRFEQVTIKVEEQDVQLRQNVLRATWTVFADDKGSFVSNWELLSNGRFTISGLGAKSRQEFQTVIASSVTPVFVSGNPTCTDINASSDPAFAHITSNFGLKIDPPASGTFTFTNSGGTVLQGGAPADASKTVTVNLTSGTTMDWSSTRSITAVIVKAGAGANVYPYNPFSFGDTNLVTPGGHGFSHLVFCFQPTVFTAARVSAGGRVTDSSGNGLAKTYLTVLNTANGESRTVISNPFGYYRFDDLEVGNFYIITAVNKRYAFETDTNSFVLNEAVDNLDFRAIE